MLLVAACGGRNAPERPQPVRGGALTNPLEIYRDLGFLTGPTQFPVVVSFATFAGPADSTYVLLAMSIPNNALRFQREGSGFLAEYEVNVAFMDRDSVMQLRSQRREAVRVPSFSETGRTDESVVHQQAFTLPPGQYLVRLDAADAHSSRGARVSDTLDVPVYGVTGASTSAAMLVYEGAGRADRATAPTLIANARHTVPYGGTAPRLYIESYDTAAAAAVVRVRGAAGDTLWSGPVSWDGAAGVRHALVDIPSGALPLGRFDVEVSGSDGTTATAPLVLTISDQWMVANFDDVLQFMRFIATQVELDSLRAGSAAERRTAWDAFWAARDPLPVTAINEFRDEFFERVRYATEAFREPGGRAGWNTDRGEVYIVLGAPDRAHELVVGAAVTGEPDAEEWIYNDVAGYRLSLTFQDRTGFGRWQLVPASAAAFRSAAERLKRMRTDVARSR